MKAILIIAHGSRREESNVEVRRLTNAVRLLAGPEIQQVACAFLEITDPKTGEAIDELVRLGITDVLVFPYFLAAGTHVVRDVPRVIEETTKRHPQMTFRILPHLGALDGISELILRQVERA
jgi:sirohydrochlorin ferrochelatase